MSLATRLTTPTFGVYAAAVGISPQHAGHSWKSDRAGLGSVNSNAAYYNIPDWDEVNTDEAALKLDNLDFIAATDIRSTALNIPDRSSLGISAPHYVRLRLGEPLSEDHPAAGADLSKITCSVHVGLTDGATPSVALQNMIGMPAIRRYAAPSKKSRLLFRMSSEINVENFVSLVTELNEANIKTWGVTLHTAR